VSASAARHFALPLALPRAWKRSVAAHLPRWARNWREAQYYLRHGELELHFLDILCAPDRDSIDVGAHDGCYVHFLRKQSRHVHAFEPIPWMAKELTRKFPQGVTVRPEALSRAEGTATLHMPLVDGHSVPGCSTLSEAASSVYGGSQDIRVPVRRLDDVYDGDVGFIKIDVEGLEIEVLEGARATIERCRPNLLIEVVEHLSPGGLRNVAEFLEPRGYAGHFVQQRNLRPVAAFDRALMQRPEDYPDLTASLDVRERFPRFIYNFIFLPAERDGDIARRLSGRLAEL